MAPLQFTISTTTIRGVQNFTGTNLTNQCRRQRPDCNVDQMSRGWRSDFALHFDAGAVKSLD